MVLLTAQRGNEALKDPGPGTPTTRLTNQRSCSSPLNARALSAKLYAAVAQELGCGLGGFFPAHLAVNLNRGVVLVAAVRQRREHGAKVEVAAAERPAVGLAQVEMADVRPVLANGIEHRPLLDVQVDGIEHIAEAA